MDSIEIQQYQQNRYPAFFVDEIKELSVGKFCKGIKYFSANEFFFRNNLIVPTVIIGEAMEQTYLMTFLTLSEYKGKKTSTVSVSADFFREVKCGETLEIIANLLINSRGMTRGESSAFVGDEMVAKAEFTVIIPSITMIFKPKK